MYDFLNGFHSNLGNWERANILVVGDSGVGKTTLINTIFGEEKGKTGRGAPITPDFQYQQTPDGSVGIWDSAGFEISDTDEEFYQKIDEQISKLWDDPSGPQIHLAWFVFSVQKKFDTSHLRIVERARELGIESVVVVTHISRTDGVLDDSDVEYLGNAESFFASKVHAVIALNSISTQETPEVFGMDSLIEISSDLLPEVSVKAFEIGQQINFERKRVLAKKVIERYAKYAALAAAQPIPFVDGKLIDGFNHKLVEELAEIYRIDKNVVKQLWPLLEAYVSTVGFVKSLADAGIAKIASKFLKTAWPVALATSAVFAAIAMASIHTLGRAFISAAEKQAIGTISDGVEFFQTIKSIYEPITEESVENPEIVEDIQEVLENLEDDDKK